ncbi:GFA family protein [Ancylobacter sp. G4_0304]|uniref:GFA family protein n=1 Tax=Ancylobacter sp. G4_0304 TaxID=3114289 RepID=UPI0039C5BE23
MNDETASTPLPPLHSGGCHCGAVRFETRVDLSHVITCNCSICTAKGLLLAFTPAENFTLQQGGDRLNEYRFNRHVIGHMFCTACGTEPFARATTPDGVPMVALNVRCLDGVDIAALNPMPYDGRNS